MKGSALGLKWAHHDLANLEAVLAITPGRSLAIQAGGHLGVFARRLAAEFEAVYTFEPDAENFRMLCANVPEPNVFKFQAALGSHKARVGWSRTRRDGKPVRHEGTHHVAGKGNVPAVRIDDFVADVIDLIYLDVEGWEAEALEGAFNTLSLHHGQPVVVVEINRNLELAGYSRDGLYEFLAGCGYREALRINSDVAFTQAPRMGAKI